FGANSVGVAVEEGVIRHAGAVGVDAQQLPVQHVNVLNAKGIGLGSGVGDAALADQHPKFAVGAEGQLLDGVLLLVVRHAILPHRIAIWIGDLAQDYCLAAGESFVGIVGINLEAAHALGLGPELVFYRRAGVFVHIAHIEIAVAGKVGIERQAHQSAVATGIHPV